MHPPLSNAARASTRRFLETGFTVMDVAEAILAFGEDRPAEEAAAVLDELGFETCGVRHDEFVVGYALRPDLVEGTRCGDHLRYFGSDEIVNSGATLRSVIERLDHRPHLYVVVMGSVGGIVTRRDLEKPPMRMWLFGLLTLLEQITDRHVAQLHPNDGWTEVMNPKRLAKAQALLDERQRRKRRARLLECLTFADKGDILTRNKTWLARSRFPSRNEARRVFTRVEHLRNALAHAQPFVDEHWQTVRDLATDLDPLLNAMDRV